MKRLALPEDPARGPYEAPRPTSATAFPALGRAGEKVRGVVPGAVPKTVWLRSPLHGRSRRRGPRAHDHYQSLGAVAGVGARESHKDAVLSLGSQRDRRRAPREKESRARAA